MLVTMQNSDLINKLLLIADGDIELVQTAIRASADKDDDGADLKKVVQYIVLLIENGVFCAQRLAT